MGWKELICLECDEIFHEDELKKYVEKHGLDSPPYEEYWACPYCAGAFEELNEPE